MAYKFLMTIEGTRQGKFKGQPIPKERSGSGKWLELSAFSFGSTAPLDTSTGVHGHRPFNVIKITKDSDSASPLLMSTIINSAVLKPFALPPVGGGNTGGGGSGSGSGGSGSNKGKGSHPPIVVTRTVDFASPLLFNAHFSSELLKTVQISFTPTGPGKPEHWQTITLTNATIANVRRMTTPGSPQPHEDIHFVYEGIESSYGPPK